MRPRWAEIVGLSFAWDRRGGWYLPFRAPPGENHLDMPSTLEALRPVLEDPAIGKIGQNLKYDIIVFRAAGVALAGLSFDTMVASYLLDAGRRNHNLNDLAKRYLNHATIKIAELIGSGKNQLRMDQVPVAQVTDYAVEDAWLPVCLRPILAEKLAAAELADLLVRLELPLVEVLAEMEYTGIKVDVGRLAELSRRYGQRMAALEREIYELAGYRFNIASPKQLQRLLFVEKKLPVLKRTKTGPSTDVAVLEALAAQHPLPQKIVQYRQYAKLKGTYVDALPAMVHPTTGRVHASFNQVVTATGRLSSSDPNLQNIPVRTDEGRDIRSAFVPGQEGWVLLAADYSQIELRILAHYSGDEQLCEAFRARRGHPRPRGQPGQQRPAGRGDRGDAAAGQDGKFRRHLWTERRGAGTPAGNRTGRSRRVHRQLLQPLSGHRAVPGAGTGGMPAATAMLKPSWRGGGRFAASAKMPAAPGTSPNGPPSTRSSRAPRPT